jgi:hypothetical protein
MQYFFHDYPNTFSANLAIALNRVEDDPENNNPGRFFWLMTKVRRGYLLLRTEMQKTRIVRLLTILFHQELTNN